MHQIGVQHCQIPLTWHTESSCQTGFVSYSLYKNPISERKIGFKVKREQRKDEKTSIG